MGSESVDPFRFLDREPTNAERKALLHPLTAEFRHSDEERYNVEPEHRSIQSISADVANGNVEYRFDGQKSDEKYVCVLKTPDVTLVESIKGQDRESYHVYAIVGDEELVRTMYDWEIEENMNNSIYVIEELVNGHYAKALQKQRVESESSIEENIDPVPPPAEGDFTQE